jgi:hypothetical protein
MFRVVLWLINASLLGIPAVLFIPVARGMISSVQTWKENPRASRDLHTQAVLCACSCPLQLFAIVFAETGLVLTPFLPGDSLLFAAGAFAGLSWPISQAVCTSGRRPWQLEADLQMVLAD